MPIWAIAENEQGIQKTIHIQGPDAYLFTVFSMIQVCKQVLENHVEAGYQTPACYGLSLIEGIKEVKINSF